MKEILRKIGTGLAENWPGLLLGALIALDIIYFGVWP